jgi:hypothetical protein
MRRYFAVVLALASFAGCSGSNDNTHTTATTVVPPPPRQVLTRAEVSQSAPIPMKLNELPGKFDPTKPLLYLLMPGAGETVPEGREVPIVFSLANVKLRSDGGEYRVRYVVDDDDMQWIDRWEHVVLTGWLPGKHTIRVELIGPDGWPYRNGDYNIVTREITILK